MFFDDEDDADRRVVFGARRRASVHARAGRSGPDVALLCAPRGGEEARRGLKRRLRKVRALAEEKVDELGQRFSGRSDPGPAAELGPTDGMARGGLGAAAAERVEGLGQRFPGRSAAGPAAELGPTDGMAMDDMDDLDDEDDVAPEM